MNARVSDHGGAIASVEKPMTNGDDGHESIPGEPGRYVLTLCADGSVLERAEYNASNKRPYRLIGKVKAEFSDASVWVARKAEKGWTDLTAKNRKAATERTGPEYGEETSRGFRLRPSDARTFVPSSYTGNRIFAKPAESVTLYDLNWSGGSRSVYTFFNVSTGKALSGDFMGQPAPWSNPFDGKTVPIPEGCAVAVHHQGPNAYLQILAHPEMFPRLLAGRTE